MTRRTRPSRRGFMLLEMLGVIILLVAFGLVASKLFSWSMRVVREAPAAEQQILWFDSMLHALREDIWSAESVEVNDDRTVTIRTAGGASVGWRIDGDGSIVRSEQPSEPADARSRVCPQAGDRVRFESDEAGLLLRILDRNGRESDRMILVNERLLLGTEAR